MVLGEEDPMQVLQHAMDQVVTAPMRLNHSTHKCDCMCRM